MRADLHCHTNASDGLLDPIALCDRAAQRGVELLAITDHDTVAGVQAARDYMRSQLLPAFQLLVGIEYSSVWAHIGVHIVGLGIDDSHTATIEACRFYGKARRERAEMIGTRLTKLGMPGATEGALALAGSAQIGRPHFARYLLAQGHVRSEDEAFTRYLGAGKPGDIKALWPPMDEVVSWIRAAGGVPVLAHPIKYRQTGARLRRLVAEFAACGGQAVEVVVGRQVADESRFVGQLCQQNGLAASQGSDFHGPSPWCELGDIHALPAGSTPVWQRWVS
ncbi:MAG: phosphoesterase [Verrucomicrobiaceae bacterium]|nr:phosphoesterase [Verrucomicrobiaceae bacterium]